MRRLAGVLLVVSALCAGAAEARAPAPGARYVAMGSSFASGPGLNPMSPDAPPRCGRSSINYAHLVAKRLRLALTDVTCGGATTAHILGRWDELLPQIDAVTADTELVTLTVGGNDVSYIGTLMVASCAAASPASASCAPIPPPPSEAMWAADEAALRRIVADVRRRAPRARLILVDYFTPLPAAGECAATPLPPGQANLSRAVGLRLASMTARVALETRTELLRVSMLSQRHDPCSADPWLVGYPPPGSSAVPYHANPRGMAAVADALTALVAR